jgi:hypothetical protein
VTRWKTSRPERPWNGGIREAATIVDGKRNILGGVIRASNAKVWTAWVRTTDAGRQTPEIGTYKRRCDAKVAVEVSLDGARRKETARKEAVLALLDDQEKARARFYATGKHPWEKNA